MMWWVEGWWWMRKRMWKAIGRWWWRMRWRAQGVVVEEEEDVEGDREVVVEDEVEGSRVVVVVEDDVVG
eukprot:2760998-Rhodomonas_salina.1